MLAQVRLPRIACGAAVGASLAVAGAILQTAVRNPLADPGLLGVSSAAGLGALLAILFWPELPAMVPLGGLRGRAGGGRHSRGAGREPRPRRRPPAPGALGGRAPGDLLRGHRAADVPLRRSRARLRGVPGRLAERARLARSGPRRAVRRWPGSRSRGLAMRRLDVLLLDDATAGGLGRRGRARALRRLGARGAGSPRPPSAWRAWSASSVWWCPNGVRLLVGPEHRALLPCRALAGAALVLAADTAARTRRRPASSCPSARCWPRSAARPS